MYGAAGGVGSIATQMAVRNGARVIGVVRTYAQRDTVRTLGAHHVFLVEDSDLAGRIRAAAPEGVHRIAEIDFAGHIDLNAQIIAVGATISSYYSSQQRPVIPYWPLGFADTTLRLLGSDDFTPEVKAHAAHELTKPWWRAACRSPLSSDSHSMASPPPTNTSNAAAADAFCFVSPRHHEPAYTEQYGGKRMKTYRSVTSWGAFRPRPSTGNCPAP